ncbi:MAG: hypothetical protein ACRYG4_12160 [Janthinobacterium lividum]
MIFGGLWALVAAMASPTGWRLPLAGFAALMTVLFVARLWRKQEPVPGVEERLFGRTTYQMAVGAEVLCIYGASALLPQLGWQSYYIQAVGIIVGLHFIGLWKATRSVRFLTIAAAMCVVSTIAIALPATLHLFHVRDIFTGAGNAGVLWLGAGRSPRRKASSAIGS